MKISITFQPDNKREAAIATDLMQMLPPLFPGARVKQDDKKPPYRHIYITTRKGEASTDAEGDT